MRAIAMLVAGLALPAAGWAEQSYIRIEAKRGAELARQAAEDWQRRLGDEAVVSFALPGGRWHAVALGPFDDAAAADRLQRLRDEGAIPADAFLTPAQGIAAVAGAGAAADDTADAAAAPDPQDSESAGGDPGESAVAADPAPPSPDRYLRLEAFAERAEAERALARWREQLDSAGLWQLPDGWHVVASGPLDAPAAEAWLPALKTAGTIPSDSVVVGADEIGQPLDPGEAPGWPAPPESAAAMPPLDEAQALLKWAGHYAGEVDGRDGPMTRAAIAAAVASLRVSTDPGTTLEALARQRQEWMQSMGLQTLEDAFTGLSLTAPLQKIMPERTERGLSIYGPRDGSGAALILFAQEGGRQELLDLAGLITALGWVPRPDRLIERERVVLSGRNETHIGHAEGRVHDGMAEGWVLIWPVADAQTADRLRLEFADSFERFAPPRPEAAQGQEIGAGSPTDAPTGSAPETDPAATGDGAAAADAAEAAEDEAADPVADMAADPDLYSAPEAAPPASDPAAPGAADAGTFPPAELTAGD